jgi:hypothetical protein
MSNSNDYMIPEFKDCDCGARIRIIYTHSPNPKFPTVSIGFAACGCGDTHYSFIGDDSEVVGAAEDLERFMLSKGKGVDTKKLFRSRQAH